MSTGLAGVLVVFIVPSDPEQAYAHFVGIRPDHRRTGLGRELYQEFAAVARQRGCRKLRAVTAATNTASIHFHDRLGFTSCDPVPDYDGPGRPFGRGRSVPRLTCSWGPPREEPAMMIDRSAEADAFLTTIEASAPAAVSACQGWTTHEIAAHVTGIAIEVARHLDPYLQGDPVPNTRSFEEREAPLQALGHAELLTRLDCEEARMRRLVADVLDREPGAVIPWTGRRMAVAKFVPHLRNEHALHRWDVAGEDDLSRHLLGSEDLVDHSVGELGRILLVAGRQHDPDPDSDFRVRLRSAGSRDLLVIVDAGTATLAWADDDADEPSVDLDPVARHIFIWGRRPDRHGQAHSHLSQPDLARLQALLAGY
jgi:Acetyltransferase (GNAT) family/Mycothiol maleylpyruvate isomerase N-terminal domain